ncbi:hypothetical protein HYV43_06190 [Candidatus Micrarchaeota archaeon]|nr:hypothetical protein [Candidatus Micrarchaeota archaeon]
MAMTNYTSSHLVEYVEKTGAAKIEGKAQGGHDAHGQSGHGGGDHGRQLHHMYVPMKQVGHMMEGGKKVPVHNLHVHTRAQFLSGLVDSGFRTGALGTAYRSYFYAIVFFVLTVLTYNVSLYVAAVFAYMAGLHWSRRLIEPPWSVTWFKGKALYHTK